MLSWGFPKIFNFCLYDLGVFYVFKLCAHNLLRSIKILKAVKYLVHVLIKHGICICKAFCCLFYIVSYRIDILELLVNLIIGIISVLNRKYR